MGGGTGEASCAPPEVCSAVYGHFVEQINNTFDLAQKQTLAECGWRIMNTTSHVKPIDWSNLDEIPRQ